MTTIMFIKVPALEEDIGSYDKHQGDVDASNQTRNNRAFIFNSSDLTHIIPTSSFFKKI